MRILVTNDDGINAPGIIRLAEAAKKFGDVYVVAPKGQCSAMSQKITIAEGIKVTEALDFPIENVKAFHVGGTPADCVKIAVEYLMDEEPDIVFSGVNKGYNAGLDIAYSGTVAAAMEAVMKGFPAIAFSKFYDDDYRLVDEKLYEVIGALIHKPAGKGKMWNVNFPEGEPEACKGILWERKLARTSFHPDIYGIVEEDESSKTIILQSIRASAFEEGTDLHALLDGYISIGTITNMIVGDQT